MPDLQRDRSIDRSPTTPRCPWCGSLYTSISRSPSRRYYCHACFRAFAETPEAPYDVIADEWTPALAALQASGELIAVRLGGGFYGICLLTGRSDLATALEALSRDRRAA